MTGRTSLKSAHPQRDSLALELRFLIIIISLCSIVAIGVLRTPEVSAASARPANYSCAQGPGGEIHCYGENEWPGGQTGGATSIYVVGMNGGNGFVTNTIWVGQTGNPNGDCASHNNTCWVEGGYAAQNGEENWYWADVRPCSCGGYHEHDSAPLQYGDFDEEVNIGIYQTSSSTWAVNVDGYVTSISGTSTGQTMNANYIFIGQELEGSSGASAPETNYTFNEWRNGSGVWNVQGVDGKLDPCSSSPCPNYNPPWAGWVSGEDPAHYYGGNFYTYT